MIVVWLVAFVVFLVMESVTISLTSIWFAGGALIALAVQVLGGGIKVQLTAFVLVSFLLFIIVRPFAARYVQTKSKRTQAGNLVGRKVRVKKRIDNRAGTGSAVLAGDTWMARAASDDEVLEPDTMAVVTAVSGAKLIVTAEEHKK